MGLVTAAGLRETCVADAGLYMGHSETHGTNHCKDTDTKQRTLEYNKSDEHNKFIRNITISTVVPFTPYKMLFCQRKGLFLTYPEFYPNLITVDAPCIIIKFPFSSFCHSSCT